MQAGMQEVLPRGPYGQAVHRSRLGLKDRLHLRAPLYRMRYLPEEMPVRCDQHHQPADEPEHPGHT